MLAGLIFVVEDRISQVDIGHSTTSSLRWNVGRLRTYVKGIFSAIGLFHCGSTQLMLSARMAKRYER